MRINKVWHKKMNNFIQYIFFLQSAITCLGSFKTRNSELSNEQKRTMIWKTDSSWFCAEFADELQFYSHTDINLLTKTLVIQPGSCYFHPKTEYFGYLCFCREFWTSRTLEHDQGRDSSHIGWFNHYGGASVVCHLVATYIEVLILPFDWDKEIDGSNSTVEPFSHHFLSV